MIQSHDNLTYSTHTMYKNCGFRPGLETLLSYLPPSHAASLIVDCFMMTSIAASVYFADKEALKGKLVDNLKEVSPTILVAVPRVLEKIEERIRDAAAGGSAAKRALLDWAKRTSHEHHDRVRRTGDECRGWKYRLADRLVYR